MDKQNELYPDNEILLGHTKKWSIDTCYNLDEFKNGMLSESQAQKTTYCMCLLIIICLFPMECDFYDSNDFIWFWLSLVSSQ